MLMFLFFGFEIYFVMFIYNQIKNRTLHSFDLEVDLKRKDID